MESRTIIVMSDSHVDREIVSNIKQRYQGEVDAIFHNVILSYQVQILFGMVSKWFVVIVIMILGILKD